MVTFISHSPGETLALGESWGREARSGWIIGLSGGLGAGKTQLVKGIARGLGIKARIQSPTFALVNEYNEGRLPLAHLDLYRLDRPEQITGTGLDEYFRRPSGIVVIEWCERWPEFQAIPGRAVRLPEADTVAPAVSCLCLRLVRIGLLSELSRQITYEDLGD
jgi:tRNA threonylcarbamoyladenosine biosynthesis protein TsaE